MFNVLNNDRELVLAYDIETGVRADAAEYLSTADLGYDKRLKDPAKIEESRKEKRLEAIEKAPLYWWYGRVVSISFEEVLTGEKWALCCMDEKKLLTAAFDYLKKLSTEKGKEIALVGKNSSGFDRGYLIGRAVALDTGVPLALRKCWGFTDDIDQLFGGKLSSQCGKLSEYAFGLGMSKIAHGSEVAEMLRQERYDDILRYNEQDTAIVAEILRRYMRVY